MKRLIVPSLLVAMIAIGLGACAPYVPHARVVRANYNVSRGEYQAAIVDYLRALESEEYDGWLAYNLANVYHYLGESGAALDRWTFAKDGDVEDLVFGASFNTGVYLYEQGRYVSAFEQFRYALTIDPTNIDAKRNLELALEKITAETEITDEAGAGVSPGSSDQAEGELSAATRMLDYVRRKEEQRWRAATETLSDGGYRDW